MPAGITAFTPFYFSAEEDIPYVNLSMARPDPELDILQSNYTIEIPLLDRAHAYQSVSQSTENLGLPDCLHFRLVHQFHGHCSPDGIYVHH